MNVWKKLGIQSKLIVTLLLVSLLSILTVSYVGYSNARAALSKRIRDQLVAQRIEKTHVLQQHLGNLRNQVVSLSDTRRAIEGVKEFSDAFRALKDASITRDMEAKLRGFYASEFIPGLAKSMDGYPSIDQYFPGANTTRYLQYHYIANNPGPYLKKYAMVDAEDGSTYSAIHRKYQPLFARIAKTFHFEDILLIDAENLDIVYDYQKSTEFGTNLMTGPYADSNLGNLARATRKLASTEGFKMADFEAYAPSLGAPSGFIGSPIFEGPRMTGILVFQFPIDEVSRIMTGDFNWEREGLGKTGEVYLVGKDFTIRSRSRFMYEDPKGFLAVLRENGVAESVVRKIEHQGTALMALPVSTPSAEAALHGKEGIITTQDYRNTEVLSAYGPIDLDSVRWAVIAEMDSNEAFAPIRDFAQNVIISGTGLALLTSLLALWFARYLVRPIRQLAEGARRVAAGEADVHVHVDTQDEFKELADAFNGMTVAIEDKTRELEHKVRENEELLLNILPAPTAARIREGETETTERFADVSVLFADLSGFGDTGDEKSLNMVNELVVAFDEAAERSGVEKVKTIGSAYLAVCGLSVQRPDHVNRILDFASDMQIIVRRFNADRDLNLSLEVGINAGPVVGGIVGRSKFIYDLWGDTVTIARTLSDNGVAGIMVTDGLYQRHDGSRSFQPGGEVLIKGKGLTKTWRLQE